MSMTAAETQTVAGRRDWITRAGAVVVELAAVELAPRVRDTVEELAAAVTDEASTDHQAREALAELVALAREVAALGAEDGTEGGADPLAEECGGCGAEVGEECRPACLGGLV